MKKFFRFNLRGMALIATLIVNLVAMADTYTQEFTYQAYKYKLDTSKKTAQLVQDPDYKAYTSAWIPRVITYKNEEYTVNNIGQDAFLNCEKIKELNIPSSITYINSDAFMGCSGVTKVTFDAAMNMTSTTLKGLSNIEDFQLSALSKTKAIGASTFASKTKLKKFKSYSSALTSIGISAFSGCTSLEEASFYAAEITSIGNYAFYNCTSLKNLYFQKKTIGGIWENAFENCTSLNCDFSDMPLKTISNYAFNNCNLTSFAFPATLQTLGKNAFAKNNLTSIDLSNTQVTTLSEGAFSDNTKLKSITLPACLTSIGQEAFSNNQALATLNLSSTSIKTIGQKAFKNCTSLNRIILPTTLTNVYNAFDGCNALKQVFSNAVMAPSINTDDLFPNCTTTAADRTLVLTNGSRTDTYIYNCWDKFFKIASPVPTAINLSNMSVSLFAGTSTYTLTTTITPAIANNVVTWASSNDAIATVGGGIITPKSAGTCTITATTSNGLKATCSVTVHDVSSVTLNNTYASIQKGSTVKLSATVSPSNACQDITWESSIPNIARVNSDGTVTGVSKGTCTITAYSWNKKKYATCEVTVTQPEIKFDYYSLLLKPGEDKAITATAPSSDYMSFTWSSSNSSVATVNSYGDITAVSEGTCVITCSPNYGNMSSITAPAKCVVTVSNDEYIYVGNIYYQHIEDEPTHLRVTNMGLSKDGNYRDDVDRGEYSATVTIPSTISYNGVNYTVTQIGRYAFYRMRDLQMAVIPPTVEIINEHAFERSENMVRVVFQGTSKLNTIKFDAFKGCKKLNYVVLPNSVKTVEDAAFMNCSSLSDFTLSTGMKAISNSLCENDEVLDNLVLPDGIVTIGKRAFYKCTSLNKITYSQNLSLINEFAFGYCNSLTSVTLPSKVAAIQNYAYRNCENLQTMTTPASLEGIGALTFYNCNRLKTITLRPASPMTIGEAAFERCDSLNKVNIENVGVWAQTNFANIYSNPLYYAHHLYMGGTKLTEITVPSSATFINQYAFIGATDITSVTLPATMLVVSDEIFGDCIKLKTLKIDATTPPLYVGTRSLYHSYKDLKSVAITVPAASAAAYQSDDFWGHFTINGKASTKTHPEACERTPFFSRSNFHLNLGEERALTLNFRPNTGSISYESSNSYVVSVNNSGEIKGVDSGTAEIRLRSGGVTLCTAVVEVSSDDPMYVGIFHYNITSKKTVRVTNMGLGAAPNYPESIKRHEYTGVVRIPSSVTYAGVNYPVEEIKDYGFYQMRDLQKTIIPATVAKIGLSAFEDSQWMKRVAFSSGSVLSTMLERAFYRCKQLDCVKLPDGLYTIDKSTFRYCDVLSDITLPAKLSMIDEYGFANCPKLQRITFPSTLASIQNYCFAFDDILEHVTIPKSTVGIGAFCFRDCKALKTIRFSNSQAMTIGESAFYNCDALQMTYVDNLDKYVETNFFNQMANPTYFSKKIGQFGNELIMVTVPSTASFINQYALVNCKNITLVDLPSSILTVSDNIFLGCDKLTSVFSRASVPPAFIGTRDVYEMKAVFDRATLYVPGGSVSKYKNDSYWKLYSNITDLKNFVNCDVNNDGKVNSTDIVAIYNYISTKTGVTLEKADVNGDGKVNSTDIVTVYNHI